MLDIVSDYMRLRGFQHQRLDGSTPAAARHHAMEQFNRPESTDFAFLLSTRWDSCWAGRRGEGTGEGGEGREKRGDDATMSWSSTVPTVPSRCQPGEVAAGWGEEKRGFTPLPPRRLALWSPLNLQTLLVLFPPSPPHPIPQGRWLRYQPGNSGHSHHL